MGQWANNVYDIFKDIDTHSGYRRREHFKEIEEPEFWETYEKFKPYSLCGVQKFYNVFCSIRHLAHQGEDQRGDIVECGVFFGGMIGAMIDWSTFFGWRNKTFWLFDTFEGFTVPDSQSLDLHGNLTKFSKHPNFRDVVEDTLSLANRHPSNNVRYIVGPVEKTLCAPVEGMDLIFLLRLDTDYYESTKIELEKLYPLVARGGTIIVDDYGHFKGSRQATDEYMKTNNIVPLWNRIDYSCWSMMKW
jgi:O-methyltransferase